MALSRRQFLVSSGSLAAAVAAPGRPDRKLRVCIIGNTAEGGYGHSLHMAWALHQDVEIVALADPDEAGRLKRARECRATRTYADYVEMLEKERPDMVTIAPRWTNRHREYLDAALQVGAHGFMEKPVADNLVDADAMVRAIDANNLKWSVAFNFRVHPVIEHVRKLIFEQNLIGDLLEVRGRGKEDHRAGGEDLLVLGVHNFDLMRHLLGDPAWCAAGITVDGRPAQPADARPATEPVGRVAGDRLWAAFGFPNGVTGYFASAKNADGNGGRWGLDFCGSKGIVSIRMDSLGQAGYFPEPAWDRGPKNVQWQPLPNAPSAEMKWIEAERYLPITQDLVAAIKEGKTPRVTLAHGRDALEMVQAVYAAHFAGGRADLPLKNRVHPLAQA